MRSLSEGSPTEIRSSTPPAPLLIGDVSAFLLFVVVGRISHGFTSDWLINVARIATPFLIGWFVAAFILGAYRISILTTPSSFLARSAGAVVIGNLIAFGLRSILFQNNVTLPFALTSIAFTTLFVMGWRAAYTWWYNQRASLRS